MRIVRRNNEMIDEYLLNITEAKVTSEKSVTLLGIEIENKLSFEKHSSSLCKKSKQSTKRDKLN